MLLLRRGQAGIYTIGGSETIRKKDFLGGRFIWGVRVVKEGEVGGDGAGGGKWGEKRWGEEYG
jgi:hypothetical protein